MKIKPKQVKRTAELARLEFSQKQLDQFIDHFEKLLGFFEQLQEVDTSQVVNLHHPLSTKETPFREDCVRIELTRKNALKEAPDSSQGHFKVPKVIES